MSVKDPKARAEINKRYRARLRGENVPLRVRAWTKEECLLLVRTYTENVGSKTGWLNALSRRLHRDVTNIVRKAKSLGCKTDYKRKGSTRIKQLQIRFPLHTPEELSQQHSERMRVIWKMRPHPRGMLGKQHSEEAKSRMSFSRFGKRRGPFTASHRQAIAAAVAARLRQNPESFSRMLQRGKSGRRADLNNQYFRSRYEANYARFLNFTKVEWDYESKTFWFDKIKRGSRSYTPDFYLPATNEYHEVKGWMDPKSATKLKRMAKHYPDVKIVLIDGEWFRAANRQGLCRLIPGWECRHKRHMPGEQAKV